MTFCKNVADPIVGFGSKPDQLELGRQPAGGGGTSIFQDYLDHAGKQPHGQSCILTRQYDGNITLLRFNLSDISNPVNAIFSLNFIFYFHSRCLIKECVKSTDSHLFYFLDKIVHTLSYRFCIVPVEQTLFIYSSRLMFEF